MLQTRGLLLSVALLALPFAPSFTGLQDAQEGEAEAGEERPWLNDTSGFVLPVPENEREVVRARHASHLGSDSPWRPIPGTDFAAILLSANDMEAARTLAKDYQSRLIRRYTAMVDWCERGSPGCADGYDGHDLKRTEHIDAKHKELALSARRSLTFACRIYWVLDRTTNERAFWGAVMRVLMQHLSTIVSLDRDVHTCHVPAEVLQSARAELADVQFMIGEMVKER